MTPTSQRLADLRRLLLAGGMTNLARSLHEDIVDVARMERSLNEIVQNAKEEADAAVEMEAQRREKRGARFSRPADVLPFRRPVPVFLVGEEPPL